MARMIHSHIAAISRLVNIYNHMDFAAVPITLVSRTNLSSFWQMFPTRALLFDFSHICFWSHVPWMAFPAHPGTLKSTHLLNVFITYTIWQTIKMKHANYYFQAKTKNSKHLQVLSINTVFFPTSDDWSEKGQKVDCTFQIFYWNNKYKLKLTIPELLKTEKILVLTVSKRRDGCIVSLYSTIHED